MGELRSLDGDFGLVHSACDWLMDRPDIGMVFARDDIADKLPGTLPMSLVHHSHPRDPDVFFLMRSSDAPDAHGVPGTGGLIAGVPLGGGMHGGLNRFELTTTLIVQTPGGRIGRDDVPVGLIDIAPTICDLLDVHFEATGRGLPLFAPESEEVTTEHHSDGRAGFEQRLTRRLVNGHCYLSHGGRI